MYSVLTDSCEFGTKGEHVSGRPGLWCTNSQFTEGIDASDTWLERMPLLRLHPNGANGSAMADLQRLVIWRFVA